MKRWICLSLMILIFATTLLGCAPDTAQSDTMETKPDTQSQTASVTRGEAYSDKDHVALYLNLYGELPPNFVTKREAENAGWNSHKGNLNEVMPGKSIGGDHFGNHEGVLPKEHGVSYTECDIDYTHGTRNGKRIIFSNRGDIYYTDDHYKTFTQLCKGEGR